MDHGILNLALGKRGYGSLDAQIEREVKAQKQQKRAEWIEAKEKAETLCKQAHEMLPALLNNRGFISKKAASLNISANDLRSLLRSMADDYPRRLIDVATAAARGE